MAPTIPTIEPTVVVPGDTWKWDKTLSDYPASDGWQLSYYVRGPKEITLAWGTEVTANVDTFEVRVEETKTDDLTVPGPHHLIGRITDGTDTYTVIRCPIDVLRNPATAVLKKSFAQQMVEAIDEAIKSNAGAYNVIRVSVGGRTTEFSSPDEAIRARARWEIQYLHERRPNTRLLHAGKMVPS